jgi:Helix-turn-helix domain
MPSIPPLLVDTKTACELLGIKRTKLFELLKQKEGGLTRRKIGSKTLVTMSSIEALAEKGA